MTRRLLAIGAVDHPGGAEIHLLRLIAALAPRGWEITVTTPGRGPLAEQAQAAGARWERLSLGGLERGAGAAAPPPWARPPRPSSPAGGGRAPDRAGAGP